MLTFTYHNNPKYLAERRGMNTSPREEMKIKGPKMHPAVDGDIPKGLNEASFY